MNIISSDECQFDVKERPESTAEICESISWACQDSEMDTFEENKQSSDIPGYWLSYSTDKELSSTECSTTAEISTCRGGSRNFLEGG